MTQKTLCMLALVALGLANATNLKVLSDGPKGVDCGTTSDPIHVSSFVFSPTNPKLGSPMNMTAKATANGAVSTGAVMSLAAYLDGDEMFQSSNNSACGSTQIPLPLGLGNIDIMGLPCPVKSGQTFSIGFSTTIPSIAPPGTYIFNVTTTTTSGAPVGCFSVIAPLNY